MAINTWSIYCTHTHTHTHTHVHTHTHLSHLSLLYKRRSTLHKIYYFQAEILSSAGAIHHLRAETLWMIPPNYADQPCLRGGFNFVTLVTFGHGTPPLSPTLTRPIPSAAIRLSQRWMATHQCPYTRPTWHMRQTQIHGLIIWCWSISTHFKTLHVMIMLGFQHLSKLIWMCHLEFRLLLTAVIQCTGAMCCKWTSQGLFWTFRQASSFLLQASYCEDLVHAINILM